MKTTKKETDFILPSRLYQVTKNYDIYLDDKLITYDDFQIALGIGSDLRVKTFYYLIDHKRIKLKRKA